MRKKLDTLFYSIFLRIGKQYGGEDFPLIPSLLATLVLSVMSFSLMLSVTFVINHWCHIQILRFTPDWLLYSIFLGLLVANYFLFIHKKRYLAIMERYKNKDIKSRKKETLPYTIFFLLGLFSLVIVGFIYLFFLK